MLSEGLGFWFGIFRRYKLCGIASRRTLCTTMGRFIWFLMNDDARLSLPEAHDDELDETRWYIDGQCQCRHWSPDAAGLSILL